MEILINLIVREHTEKSLKSIFLLTSSNMRSLVFYLAIILSICTLSFAYRIDEEPVEVHVVDPNTLKNQLPPQDPAIHSFPTKPTVSLIPVCAREGYFRDPFNCRKFYQCDCRNAVPRAFYCRSGIFDTITNYCSTRYTNC
ncbi:hypothetical protein ANTQUA_LOCUS7981 [Anthophora quadrimaculata]